MEEEESVKESIQEKSTSKLQSKKKKRTLIRNRYLKTTLKALSRWIKTEKVNISWYLRDKILSLSEAAYLNKGSLAKLTNSKNFQKVFVDFLRDDHVQNDANLYRQVKQFYANLLKDVIDNVDSFYR